MTFGQGKRKVLMLIDEYSSGGTLTIDRDLDVRMADFFDLAQKNIAGYQRILRAFHPEAPVDQEGAPLPLGGTVPCPAPPDFGQAFRVWRDGRLTQRYTWCGRAILLPVGDMARVMVEYFAVPKSIPADAPDTYEFEVSESAAACMPFFVAAQQLIVDLVVDPAPLLALYDRMVSALDARLPSGGGGGIRQNLFR